MNIIILAAGLGNRLESATYNKPKALVEVAGIPLVKYVLQFVRLLHPKNIVVVGGYNSGMLQKAIYGENITYIENTDYKKGNLYSLNCARSFIEEGFIQFNTDHLYPRRAVNIFRISIDGIFLLSDFDRRLFDDDMKIRVRDHSGQGAKITAISKNLETFDGGYCGVTFVKGKGIKPYLAALDRVLERGKDQAVVEDVISELIRTGCYPEVIDMSTIRWLEIDTLFDLKNAQRILRVKPNFLY